MSYRAGLHNAIAIEEVAKAGKRTRLPYTLALFVYWLQCCSSPQQHERYSKCLDLVSKHLVSPGLLVHFFDKVEFGRPRKIESFIYRKGPVYLLIHLQTLKHKRRSLGVEILGAPVLVEISARDRGYEADDRGGRSYS